MNGARVQEYVDRSKQLIEASPQMDEENTKVRLVQPFLELLGWDLYSTEVELEYTVPMASGDTRVDYALLVGDSPAVFVEAKPSRYELSDEEIRQVKSYMRQDLDVDWGILTNGKEFHVLTKGSGFGSDEEISVAHFDLDDLSDTPEMLEILTKDAIRSGRADEIAEQVARANEAIQYLSTHEQEVARGITEVVHGEVGRVPLDLEEQARDFVLDLISALQEQRRFVGEDSGPDGEVSVQSEGSDGNLVPKANKVAGTISRSELDGDPDATVVVFPSKPSGLTFLKENEAWGFVRVGRDFDSVAMYVSDDNSSVRYFAEVDEVVDPEEAELQRPSTEYQDDAKIAEDKMVVVFEPGTLYELEDPIPFENKYPQSLRYTSFEKFKQAETTDDLL